MQNNLSKLLNIKARNIGNSEDITFSYFPNGRKFPLVIKPTFSGVILPGWVKENLNEFINKLEEYGAILFRGFHINTVEKFEEFISSFGATSLVYKQRSSPRFELARNIYYSTTHPADQHINMHSENSYSTTIVRKIVFCCIQPAENGGETPIAGNELVLSHISEGLKNKFLNLGVKYVRNIDKNIGLPWQEVFQTNIRDEVEEECRKNKMEFKWINEDRLIISWNNSAIQIHPGLNRDVWFNHAFFFNKYALENDVRDGFKSDDELAFNTYFGDGTPISQEEIEEIRNAYTKSTTAFSWEKGDVLFLDNLLMSHGRSPYLGERKVIVSML